MPCNLRRVFCASLEKIGKGGERAHVFQSKVEHAAKKSRNSLTPGVFNPGLQTFNPSRVVVEHIVVWLQKASYLIENWHLNAR